MSNWVPVSIVAFVVVCVTTYLLLDPKFPSTKKRPLGNSPMQGAPRDLATDSTRVRSIAA
jgi:hypothetical protein